MKRIFFFLPLIAVSLFSSALGQIEPTKMSIDGLKDVVTVRRDSRGIPYIEAKNDTDLYFAQGYVMAGDRLFQMDSMRRLARGTTAEVFGTQNWCCGGGGGVSANDRAEEWKLMAFKKKKAQIEATGVKTMVTACANCRIVMEEALEHFHMDIEIVGLTELLAEHIAEETKQ